MHNTILLTVTPPRARLCLRGEFDLAMRDQLRRRLDDAVETGCLELTVDVADVTFVDSGTLRILAEGAERFASLGREYRVVGQSPYFARLASLAQYWPLMQAAPSMSIAGR
jgi:anti-anti-sigma factor